MATITPVVLSEAAVSVPLAASSVSGDVVSAPSLSDDYIIEFESAASGTVTVTIPAAQASQNIAALGVVTKPDITHTIAPGASYAIWIKASLLPQYLNGSQQIPINYGSGDVNLKVRAIRVPN